MSHFSVQPVLQCWVTLVLSIADELANREQHNKIIKT